MKKNIEAIIETVESVTINGIVTTKSGKELLSVEYENVTFFLKKSAAFDNDFIHAIELLDKYKAGTITKSERIQLLYIYQPSFHTDGKIEDSMSFDSSCHGCGFCAAMRRAAAENVLHICGYCYDAQQENRWIEVRNRHQLNMLIMSTVPFEVEELKSLRVAQINRINSSGDVPNQIYAENMLKIAYAFPFFDFGFWAKNTVAVIAACEHIGKPENVKLVQSSPIINQIVNRQKYFDFVFIVCSDEETTLKMIEKFNGCECNGKKCKVCGWKCYRRENGWTIGSYIFETLRATKKDIKTINDYITKH